MVFFFFFVAQSLKKYNRKLAIHSKITLISSCYLVKIIQINQPGSSPCRLRRRSGVPGNRKRHLLQRCDPRSRRRASAGTAGSSGSREPAVVTRPRVHGVPAIFRSDSPPGRCRGRRSRPPGGSSTWATTDSHRPGSDTSIACDKHLFYSFFFFFHAFSNIFLQECDTQQIRKKLFRIKNRNRNPVSCNRKNRTFNKKKKKRSAGLQFFFFLHPLCASPKDLNRLTCTA